MADKFTWENFTLGLAGAVDLANRADDALARSLGLEDNAVVQSIVTANNTQLSVSTYAGQVVEGAESYSEKISAAKTPAERALLATAGGNVGVEKLSTAANATARGVFSGVVEKLRSVGALLPWLAGAAAVSAGVVVAYRVTR